MRRFIFCILLILLFSCKSDNETTFEHFNNQFLDSIEKSNAVKYDFHYDGLVPQSSFFVGNKLKFLKYSHVPEMGLIESLVFFDLETDSISKIIRRRTSHKWDDKNKVFTENFTDTIFVIHGNLKETLTYVGNKQISSIFNEREFEIDRKFIKRIKEATEKRYNGS